LQLFHRGGWIDDLMVVVEGAVAVVDVAVLPVPTVELPF